MVEFASGAKRSEVMPRFDLIPQVALERLAQRFSDGAAKYGAFNWQRGLPAEDVFNHAINHLYQWVAGARQGAQASDDDLAGAMWGIAVLMEFERTGQIVFGSLDPNRLTQFTERWSQLYGPSETHAK